MYFTIDWPHNHIFGAEHLKLAFEDVAEAESWHQHLERAIGARMSLGRIDPSQELVLLGKIDIEPAS